MNRAHDLTFNFSNFFLTFFIFITQSIFPFKLQIGDYSNDINISNTNNIFSKRQNNNTAKENVRKDLFKEFIHLMNHSNDIIFNLFKFFSLYIFFLITQSIFPIKLQVGDYNNEINISNTNNIVTNRHKNITAKKDVRKDHFKEFIYLMNHSNDIFSLYF